MASYSDYDELYYGLDSQSDNPDQLSQVDPGYAHQHMLEDGQRKKRKRRMLNATQQSILEDVFLHVQNPSSILRANLAAQLDLPHRNIQIWFQNRRAKHKRGSKTSENAPQVVTVDATPAAPPVVAASASEDKNKDNKKNITVSPSRGAKERQNRRAACAPYPKPYPKPPPLGRPKKHFGTTYPSPDMVSQEALAYGAGAGAEYLPFAAHAHSAMLGLGQAMCTCDCYAYPGYPKLMRMNSSEACPLPPGTCGCSYYMPYYYVPDSPPMEGTLAAPATDAANTGEDIKQEAASCQETAEDGQKLASTEDNALQDPQTESDESDVEPEAEDDAVNQAAASLPAAFPDSDGTLNSLTDLLSSTLPELGDIMNAATPTDMTPSPAITAEGQSNPEAYLQAIYGDLSNEAFVESPSLPADLDCTSLYIHPSAINGAPQQGSASDGAPPDAENIPPLCTMSRSQSFQCSPADAKVHPMIPLRRRHSIAAFDPTMINAWPMMTLPHPAYNPAAFAAAAAAPGAPFYAYI